MNKDEAEKLVDAFADAVAEHAVAVSFRKPAARSSCSSLRMRTDLIDALVERDALRAEVAKEKERAAAWRHPSCRACTVKLVYGVDAEARKAIEAQVGPIADEVWEEMVSARQVGIQSWDAIVENRITVSRGTDHPVAVMEEPAPAERQERIVRMVLGEEP